MDEDLTKLTAEQLLAECRRLREGVREHRDSTGHGLCWHHPKLWGLLPERSDPQPTVPDWPQFMRGCIHYRQSLDDQLPAAPRSAAEFAAQAEPRAPGNIDPTAQAECFCCEKVYPESALARLHRHAEVAVCDGCVDSLLGQRHKNIARVMPVLATSDVAASKEFWAKAGFAIQSYSDDFAFALRDGVELHLVFEPPSARDRGAAYLHVRDVGSLHADWSAAGLPVTEVRDEPWGMREFNVVDPGGNRVRVGQNV